MRETQGERKREGVGGERERDRIREGEGGRPDPRRLQLGEVEVGWGFGPLEAPGPVMTINEAVGPVN